MSTDFPDDLVQLQRDLHAATAALKSFLDERPHSPEPADGWTDRPGEGYWRERHRDASPGWSDDDKAREVELRKALLGLIDQVHTHPYWDTLSGADLVKARMALKHVDDPVED